MIVTALSVTPVKGTRLQTVDEIELERAGARGNRRFFVIDERARMVNGKQLGGLQTVLADVLPGDRLRLTFPDGRSVEEEIAPGEPVTARFFSRQAEAVLVDGALSNALSEHLGQTVRIVQSEGSVDRGAGGAVSLISQASLRKLAEEAGEESVDARRFRMLVEIDGVDAHAEDAWIGQRAAIGDAVVRFRGHVGRCLITSRDPDSGEIDLPTLDVLGAYRHGLETTEPLAFGIYGEVLRPGRVRVGDALALL